MAKYEVKSLYVSLPKKLAENDRFGNKKVITYRLGRGDVFGTAKGDNTKYHYTEDTALVEKLAEGGYVEKLNSSDSVSLAVEDQKEEEEEKETPPASKGTSGKKQ